MNLTRPFFMAGRNGSTEMRWSKVLSYPVEKWKLFRRPD